MLTTQFMINRGVVNFVMVKNPAMSKLNRYHILGFFIFFSIVLFFMLRWAISGFFTADSADFFTQFGQAIYYIPVFLGVYLVLLISLSSIMMFISKRKNRYPIYLGSKYAQIYSILISMLLIIMFITKL
jgi:hypothetical protein